MGMSQFDCAIRADVDAQANVDADWRDHGATLPGRLYLDNAISYVLEWIEGETWVYVLRLSLRQQKYNAAGNA